MNATQDKTYNGWTNYETWCVNLWLTNNEYDAEWLSKEAAQAKESGRIALSMDALKEAIEEQFDLWKDERRENQPATMFDDLMNAALAEVNWYEIIENHMEDLDD